MNSGKVIIWTNIIGSAFLIVFAVIFAVQGKMVYSVVYIIISNLMILQQIYNKLDRKRSENLIEILKYLSIGSKMYRSLLNRIKAIEKNMDINKGSY